MRRLLSCRKAVTPSRFCNMRSRDFCSSMRQEKNVFIPLHQRNYFKIEGKDTYKFLQGIITNDINQLQTQRDCLACAILNPKGRIVADIFVYNFTSIEDGEDKCVLLEVHAAQAAAVHQYLSLYKLRSKIKITAQQGQYKTFFSPSGRQEVLQAIAGGEGQGEGQGAELLVTTDPRAAGFGTRVLLARSSERGEAFSARLLASATTACSLAPPGLYQTRRMLWGLGEGGEIEGMIPLEANLDLTHLVSFTKGCYLGQELTARTKYKGVVRKRLLPFLLYSKDAAAGAGASSSPHLTSVFGDAASSGQLPLFPVMSAADQSALLRYLEQSGSGSGRDSGSNGALEDSDEGGQPIVRKDKDGNEVVWAGDDELTVWSKLRLFQSSAPVAGAGAEAGAGAAKPEEKMVGKIISVDGKYDQERFRLGLGLVTLSAVTAVGDSAAGAGAPGAGAGAGAGGHRAFSVLNEQLSWSADLQVLRPGWWPDHDPLTGKTILPEETE